MPEILTRERVLEELDAVLRGFLASGVVRCHDRDAFGRKPADVPQNQRQHALSDAAEADEYQATRKMCVDRVLGHGAKCTGIQ